MTRIFGSLRLKVFILLTLLVVAFQMSWNVSGTKACVECRTLTGGLCVGCVVETSGHTSCTPRQETCDCVVSGACTSGNGEGGDGGGGVGE